MCRGARQQCGKAAAESIVAQTVGFVVVVDLLADKIASEFKRVRAMNHAESVGRLKGILDRPGTGSDIACAGPRSVATTNELKCSSSGIRGAWRANAERKRR